MSAFRRRLMAAQQEHVTEILYIADTGELQHLTPQFGNVSMSAGKSYRISFAVVYDIATTSSWGRFQIIKRWVAGWTQTVICEQSIVTAIPQHAGRNTVNVDDWILTPPADVTGVKFSLQITNADVSGTAAVTDFRIVEL